jgi:chromatin remodeling complex protein RSC6
MHENLKIYRTSSDREFFNCPLKVAITLLQELKFSEPKNQDSSPLRSDSNYDSYQGAETTKLLVPTLALSQIVGTEPITREKATSTVWKYIKQNNLQDSENRRLIQCNDIIKSPHGLTNITMFELAGWITKNLISRKENTN